MCTLTSVGLHLWTGDVGYTVALIEIMGISKLVIAGVNETGPAHSAGMSTENIGWEIIRVDGNTVRCQEAWRAIQGTMQEYRKFTVGLHRFLQRGSELEVSLRQALTQHLQ